MSLGPSPTWTPGRTAGRFEVFFSSARAGACHKAVRSIRKTGTNIVCERRKAGNAAIMRRLRGRRATAQGGDRASPDRSTSLSVRRQGRAGVPRWARGERAIKLSVPTTHGARRGRVWLGAQWRAALLPVRPSSALTAHPTPAPAAAAHQQRQRKRHTLGDLHVSPKDTDWLAPWSGEHCSM